MSCHCRVLQRASAEVCNVTNQSPGDKTEALEYSIGGMLCLCLRDASPTALWSGDRVRQMANSLLLQRRIVRHVTSSFQLLDCEGVHYMAGKKPSDMFKYFKSWRLFHETFPRGRRLEDPLQPFLMPPGGDRTVNVMAFTADFPAPYVQVLDFAFDCMELRGATGILIDKFAKEKPHMTALEFMASHAVRSSFDEAQVKAQLKALQRVGPESPERPALPEASPEPASEDAMRAQGGVDCNAAEAGSPQEVAMNSSYFEALMLTLEVLE